MKQASVHTCSSPGPVFAPGIVRSGSWPGDDATRSCLVISSTWPGADASLCHSPWFLLQFLKLSRSRFSGLIPRRVDGKVCNINTGNLLPTAWGTPSQAHRLSSRRISLHKVLTQLSGFLIALHLRPPQGPHLRAPTRGLQKLVHSVFPWEESQAPPRCGARGPEHQGPARTPSLRSSPTCPNRCEPFPGPRGMRAQPPSCAAWGRGK